MELWARWIEEGEGRDELVRQHTGLVHFIVNQTCYYNKEDRVQDGMLALLIALDRIRRGYGKPPYTPYIDRYVRGHVRRTSIEDDLIRVPQDGLKKHQRIPVSYLSELIEDPMVRHNEQYVLVGLSREQDYFLQLLLEGRSIAEIARSIGTYPNRVRRSLRSIKIRSE